MTAIQWDLVALQNNDETYNFTIYYGPVPLNLTGFTATFYLKEFRTSPDYEAQKITPVITDAFLGELSVTIPRGMLPFSQRLWYRIDVTNLSGNINTLIFGVLTVLAV